MLNSIRSKELVKSLFRRVGLCAFRLDTMPRGILLEVDLGRLFPKGEDLVIFDVGANRGQTARRFSESFPGSNIYSFEPVQDSYHWLSKYAGENPRLHAFKLALGEKDQNAVMRVRESTVWSRVVNVDQIRPDWSTEQVQMARLDGFAKKQGINRVHLLKTDCEGYDLQVLHGAEGMLSEDRIDCVYCEVNFRRTDEHGDFFQIESYLRQFNFIFYGLYDYSGWDSDVSKWGFANALFVAKRVCAHQQGGR
jgi:FkbM family methyltransferase